MKTKACALLTAIIMLFSFVCQAESGYVTISDPFYTDGENVYDLAGLSANLSYAKAENAVELILRAITAYGQTAAGIEIDNETVSLYADGFSGKYTMSLNDLVMLLQEALDGNQAADTFIDGLLTGGHKTQASPEASLSIGSMISDIYNAIYADGSLIANAQTGSVDTFLHTQMSAFVVPMQMTAEELEEAILPFLNGLDQNEEFLSVLNTYMAAVPYAVNNGESVYETQTAVSLYEEMIKPLNLNTKGSAYFGEDDIFIEWYLLSGEEVALPVFLEVTNTEKPSLYMNIQAGDDIVIYATIESAEDGMNDYVEIGVLEGERTIALITYQEYENASMPVQDFYLGMTYGNALYNFSFVSSTDGETARSVHASAYLDGMEVQLSYTGAISSDYGDKNEQGVLQLATNFGIQARLNVGFGTGSGVPSEFIPEDVPAKNIVSMTEADSQLMMIDFQNLVNSLMTSLIMGVPGIAQLAGMDDAQG